MLNNLRQRGGSLAVMSWHKKLDVLIEGTWLLLIFLLPVYFNPLFHNAYNFAKASALVLLVSLLIGLVLAQWFLVPTAVKVGDLPAKLQKSPLQLATLALGLMWVVSTIFSVMPGRSWWVDLAGSVGFLPNLAWIIFFLIIAQKIGRSTQVSRALYTLLISSGIVALTGILQFINPELLPWNSVRISSTDGNPLSLSGFLAMTLPITLALIILNWYGWGAQPRSRLKFAALLALFGLQLCCLAFAQYSLTLLLFIIGVFVFFALLGIFLQRRTTLAVSILSMLLVAVIAIVLLGQVMQAENTGLPVERQDSTTTVAGQVALPTLAIRVLNWKSAAEVMIDSPEIPFNKDELHGLRRFIGYGPETFVATSQLKFPDSLKGFYTYGLLLITHPENHYLYLGVTLGILGLLAFLGVLAVFFTLGLRLLGSSNNKGTIVLAAAFVAAIAQYCVHVFFNPSRIDSELLFWLILGLTVALVKIDAAGDPGRYTGVTPGPSKVRKLISLLLIIIFVAVGSGLTVPMMVANMKVRSGFTQWDKDPNRALALFTEATLIGPEQANYQDYLGNLAFSMAKKAKADTAVKSPLLTLSELAGNTAIEIEPQLALWRYRLADREMYWVTTGGEEKKANILYLYQEADQLFPGNAVILNKWALALMLMGDYDEAGRKLAEAGQADPLWTQTSFYSGLLKSLEGHRDQAGELYVLPAKGHARLVRPIAEGRNDIDYFINFCSQAANYGVIGRVADDLKYYAADKGDWIAWTFLGITDIYAGREGEAVEAFSKSAALIPAEDIADLKGLIIGIPWNNQGLQAAANDIIASLSDRQFK